MPPIEEQDAREEREAEERRLAKERERRFKKDVQEMLRSPGPRRVLLAFLSEAGADLSPLRDDAMRTGHAIGWQDAAGWWLNAVRKHCPEREAQMRAEAKRDALNGPETDENA